jgi:branched-chain amino acid transport system permease protein
LVENIIIEVIINGLLTGGIFAILGIGMTMIFGVIRIINFAQGEFLMVGMYVVYWLFVLFGIDPYLSIFVCAPILFGLGVITQKFLVDPMIERPGFADNHMFLFFALSILMQNIVLAVWKADYRATVTSYSSSVVSVFGMNLGLTRLISFAATLVIAVVIYLFLLKTDAGRAMRAVAENRTAAKLMGVNVPRVYALAFGLGSALTGVGAVLLSPIYYVFPSVGLMFSLIMFVVAVLGGLGSFIGALFSGLIVGLTQAIVGFYIGAEYGMVAAFILLALTLVFRPAGLLGTKRTL